MPKQATKAADNEFYKARIAASKCNDRLASREGASEELGIDRTRLARIELGSLNPYPEEVLLMADYYDAPELANHYYKACYQKRNEWMVDRSSLVIAVWNGQPSGTKNTIDYANRKGTNVVNVLHNT